MLRVLGSICVLLVVLCSYTTTSQQVSCEGFRCVMKTEKSYFELDNHGARVYLLDRQGNPRKEFSSVGIGFSHVTERLKNITNPATQSALCLRANQDPYLNYDSDKDRYLGELIQIYRVSDLVTYVNILEDYPVPGIQSVRYTSWDGATSPILSITYSLSSIYHNETLGEANQYTNWTVPMSFYQPENLKFSIELPQFRWQQASTGQNYSESFAAIYMNFTYKYTEGDLITAGNDGQIYVKIVNDQYGYGLKYGVDPYYTVDNVAFRVGSVNDISDTPEFENVTGTALAPQYYTSLIICKDDVGNPFGHWDTTIYDPSIGVLFSSFPEPIQGPEAKASKKASLLGLYIALPLVVVLIAVVILVVIFVPFVYDAVLPSDPFRRHQTRKNKPQEDTTSSKSATAPKEVASPSTSSPSTTPSPSPSPTPGSWKAIQKPLLQ